MPLRAQGVDDAHLVFGFYTRVDPNRFRLVLQFFFAHAVQLAAAQHRAVLLENPDAAGDGAGGAGVVARDHHRRDPRLLTFGNGGLDLRTLGVFHADQPEHTKGAIALAHRHGEHAQPFRRQAVVAAEPIARFAAQRRHRLRRALADRQRLTAAAQRDRHGFGLGGKRLFPHTAVFFVELIPKKLLLRRRDDQGGLRRLALGSGRRMRRQNRVGAQSGKAQQFAPRFAVRRHVPRSVGQAPHRHAVLRERARLIRTDISGAAQRFHGGQSAYDGVAFRHAPHAGAEHDRHHRRQPFGNGGHRQTHGEHKAAQEAVVPQQSQPEHQRADAESAQSEDASDAFEPKLERRLRRLLTAEHVGDPAQFRVHARVRYHGFAVTRQNDGGGVHHVFAFRQRRVGFEQRRRVFFARQGFARERALLYGKRHAFDQSAVRRHAVAGAQQQNVARHELRGRYLLRFSAAQHGRLLRREPPQFFDLMLGAAFLHHAHHRVEHDDRQNDDRFQVIRFALRAGREKRNDGRRQERKHHKILELPQKANQNARLLFFFQPVFAVFAQPLPRGRFR